MKDDNRKMMSAEELRALCDLTVKLTRLHKKQNKHFSIENFAPRLLSKLIRERQEIAFPPTLNETLQFVDIERYRHKKTSYIYEVICNAKRASDGTLMVVYRNTTTGEHWVIPADEFGDGRFELLE